VSDYKREGAKMSDMIVYVSKTDGKASFGDIFFSDDEADEMVKFAEELGYDVTKEMTDKRFAEVNSPFRRINIRDIDWSDYNNILYVIEHRDKTDTQIVRGLNSEGSGFSITIKRGQIMTEYSNMLEKMNAPLTRELKVELAKVIAGKFISGRGKLANNIERMQKKGCTVGEKEGFPECRVGFNSSCFKCPHNKSAGFPIKNDADITRHNVVYNDPDYFE
jgi:hypothetical protein